MGEIDYSETSWQLDKMMPDEKDIIEEFQEIQDEGSVEDMENFIENHANDNLDYYMPEGGTLKGFAEYLCNK